MTTQVATIRTTAASLLQGAPDPPHVAHPSDEGIEMRHSGAVFMCAARNTAHHSSIVSFALNFRPARSDARKRNWFA